MIVRNHPEQGLMPHQNDAYGKASETLEQENKSAVIMPTGCGKSFVALQLMQDNSENRLLMLVPSKAIKDQMYEYICKYIGNQDTSTSLLESNGPYSMLDGEADNNNRKKVLEAIEKSKFIKELYRAYEEGKGLGYAGSTKPVGIKSKELWSVLYRLPYLKIDYEENRRRNWIYR